MREGKCKQQGDMKSQLGRLRRIKWDVFGKERGRLNTCMRDAVVVKVERGVLREQKGVWRSLGDVRKEARGCKVSVGVEGVENGRKEK